MVYLLETQKLLAQIFDDHAEKIFSEGLEELICYVRSLSLYTSNLDEEAIKDKVIKTTESIIVSAISTYLDECYPGYISQGDKYYDSSINPINEISNIKHYKAQIIKEVCETAMQEFYLGKSLVKENEARLNKKRKALSIIIVNDLNIINDSCPVLEKLEVEKISLEKRLLKLTGKEKERLLEIYSILSLNNHDN